MVSEGYGECRKCGKDAYLSNRLCATCWEGEVESWRTSKPPMHKRQTSIPLEPKNDTLVDDPGLPPGDFIDKLGRRWYKRKYGWEVEQ